MDGKRVMKFYGFSWNGVFGFLVFCLFATGYLPLIELIGFPLYVQGYLGQHSSRFLVNHYLWLLFMCIYKGVMGVYNVF